MTRKLLAVAFIGMFAALFLVFQQTAVAQSEDQKTGTSRMDTTRHGGMMSHEMMQQMQKDRAECQKINKEAEAALKEIRDARDSKDVKKLRAALDKAEKPLTDMRDHMAAHMKMMDRMQGGSMMQGGTERKSDEMKYEGMDKMRMRDTMQRGGDMQGGGMMKHKGMRDSSMHTMPADTSMMNK